MNINKDGLWGREKREIDKWELDSFMVKTGVMLEEWILNRGVGPEGHIEYNFYSQWTKSTIFLHQGCKLKHLISKGEKRWYLCKSDQFHIPKAASQQMYHLSL